MKKVDDYKRVAARINIVRMKHTGEQFTVEKLEELLRGIIPTNSGSKKNLVQNEIIIRISRGMYCFPGTAIHWKKIQNFYESQREQQRVYKKSEEFLYGKPITDIIKDLKTLGYVVLKRM